MVLETKDEEFEEFNGLNHDKAKGLVFIVSLPVLVRSHAINMRVSDDILSLRVPNIYKLELGLPTTVQQRSVSAFFDCKLRKLYIYLPVLKETEGD